MTPTLDPPKSSLTEQLNSPPKASLQILGTHFSNEQIKVIDFDLWIDCSKVAGIRSGKFLMESESDCRSWNYSANQDNCNFEEILDGWLNDQLGSSTDGRSFSWTLSKLVSFPDGDCAAMKAHIERLARRVGYGGSVEVVFHTPSIEADVLPEKHDVQIRAEWRFDCPFTPADQVWNELVMNAMVDRKKGWISLNDPKRSYGMSPFRRAIRHGNNSRIVSREQNANGLTLSVQQFSRWGCDGSS
ncbi:hypothetical protein ANOM_004631 [Aspergillus nomiae NRRL 13137]|uniref:Uncharacterized protein n=1 Tax=Aspergillus nomiae NRRL (strain ATCC 15546 / NRRL 13137 / CBS 260.88 / M93) TaxID=1509407 RepID=A0A0L1J8P7_ASPN3|nr:uncharacterized protein ANOM_004631 [Aspergillus nomiae NRRL 13137]KNG87788.1 hypothetical protein ANOM_004631 [Aspergillus nomiae NRRL 13137]